MKDPTGSVLFLDILKSRQLRTQLLGFVRFVPGFVEFDEAVTANLGPVALVAVAGVLMAMFFG